jgi:uncharacterized protein YjiS (DUF1127 family)
MRTGGRRLNSTFRSSLRQWDRRQRIDNTRSHGGIMLAGIRSALNTAFRWIDERQQRRALRELQRLDDRLLAGIGLSRGEIERVIQDDEPSRRRGEPRRELIARSSQGIMAAEPLMARRSMCPLLVVLVVLGALLSAGLVVVAAV